MTEEYAMRFANVYWNCIETGHLQNCRCFVFESDTDDFLLDIWFMNSVTRK